MNPHAAAHSQTFKPQPPHSTPPPKPQILREMDAPFESVNVLEADAIRSGMKAYSQWPTFPQVYIDGEFFGGCDIMIGEGWGWGLGLGGGCMDATNIHGSKCC